ncbi:MAG: glycosyltransferase [Anaerolineae bacterium]|nr:glycosyltransferase [Anaerolineae bacterium]
MITNHGIHQWQVVPGLPDTGGQNVFVNQFTAALAKLGFKITIANRGGYVHPLTGEWQRGLRYKDEYQRIVYLEDGKKEFVRKEEMTEQIPQLVESLKNFLDAGETDVNLVISHYWDAARIGILYNQPRPERARHVWIPHSLGTIKKRNMPTNQWANLRLDERISIELELMAQLDGVAATSSTIRQSLADDYGYTGPNLFLPPCIDTGRYHPRQITADNPIWEFLSQHSGLSPEEIRRCKIVTEISRTDTTKRKNVLIEAFARVYQKIPNSLLVISIDDNQAELAGELKSLMEGHNLESHVAVVGSVWDLLPTLYAVTDIYCTPSVMEGFGMSAQEAAATGVPVVASHLVPFAVEYLLGTEIKQVQPYGKQRHLLQQGRGAIVAQADDVDGFAHVLRMLLSDDALRRRMGENAYNITIPYFTWESMTRMFIENLGVEVG